MIGQAKPEISFPLEMHFLPVEMYHVMVIPFRVYNYTRTILYFHSLGPFSKWREFAVPCKFGLTTNCEWVPNRLLILMVNVLPGWVGFYSNLRVPSPTVKRTWARNAYRFDLPGMILSFCQSSSERIYRTVLIAQINDLRFLIHLI